MGNRAKQDYFAKSTPVTLETMMAEREHRAERQRELLVAHGKPIVSFTMNIAGEYKSYPLQQRAFSDGCYQIERLLNHSRLAVLATDDHCSVAGGHRLYAVDGDADTLKHMMMQIEEYHPLGRFWDIDVIGCDGIPLCGEKLGRQQRSCIICGKPVWECARSRTHSADTIGSYTAQCLGEYFDRRQAQYIARLAQKSLLYEVATTPKPGLVDCHNNGAHKDMDIFTFITSSCELSGYFAQCAQVGIDCEGNPHDLLSQLQYHGIEAEQEMLGATDGVNTHRGAIFSLGILCAAAGYLYSTEVDITPSALSATAAPFTAQNEWLHFLSQQR